MPACRTSQDPAPPCGPDPIRGWKNLLLPPGPTARPRSAPPPAADGPAPAPYPVAARRGGVRAAGRGPQLCWRGAVCGLRHPRRGYLSLLRWSVSLQPPDTGTARYPAPAGHSSDSIGYALFFILEMVLLKTG